MINNNNQALIYRGFSNDVLMMLFSFKQLGLQVDQYVSSHHARILSQAEIDSALAITRPSKETVLKRLFSGHSD